MHGDDAAASRVAFNARFQRWLSGLFPEQRLHYVTKGTRSRALLIEVEIMSCRARLALDPADWPVLYMALSMPDEDVACAVASELILRLSAALQGSGMPIRVCSRWLPGAWPADARAEQVPPTVLSARGMVSLLRIESGAELWSDEQGSISHEGARWLSSLRLRGKLLLCQREWSYGLLRSLSKGDVVLLGSADAPAITKLIIGMGITMQVTSELDPVNQQARATEHPTMVAVAAEGDVEAPPPSELSELQVPVSFEIDTARIALSELANISPGYVIELDNPLMQALVRLVCHGQTVGMGQLVAVGDQLGVRITRMGLKHDAADHR